LMNVSTDRLYTRAVASESGDIPPIKIYTAVVRNSFVIGSWTPLSEGTGGEALFATNSADVIAKIKTILDGVTDEIAASRLPQLSLSVTTTNTNLHPGDRLTVTYTIINSGSTDATSVLVESTWPCPNNMVVSFPSGPFTFQVVENILKVLIESPLYAGGGSYAYTVSSDGVCNTTVSGVTATATDVPTNSTSGPTVLAVNSTSAPPAPSCGALSVCGDACYNTAQYDCASDILYPKGLRTCGAGMYEVAAYDCINNVLCPKDNLLCGTDACYNRAAFVCIDSVKLCPVTHPSKCDNACFNTAEKECCNNTGVADKLCDVGLGCAC